MASSAPLGRLISSGRVIKSGIRIRPGLILRALRLRPNSAAVANSTKGLAMVDAKTKLRPIDTRVAITNIWSTRSRSLRTSVSISSFGLARATTPTGCDPRKIGVAADKTIPPQDNPARRIQRLFHHRAAIHRDRHKGLHLLVKRRRLIHLMQGQERRRSRPNPTQRIADRRAVGALGWGSSNRVIGSFAAGLTNNMAGDVIDKHQHPTSSRSVN